MHTQGWNAEAAAVESPRWRNVVHKGPGISCSNPRRKCSDAWPVGGLLSLRKIPSLFTIHCDDEKMPQRALTIYFVMLTQDCVSDVIHRLKSCDDLPAGSCNIIKTARSESSSIYKAKEVAPWKSLLTSVFCFRSRF